MPPDDEAQNETSRSSPSRREYAFALITALLFTAGFAHAINDLFSGLVSPGATLPVALYVYAKEEGEFGAAFAIAAILMFLTLIINFSASLVGKYFAKRRSV